MTEDLKPLNQTSICGASGGFDVGLGIFTLSGSKVKIAAAMCGRCPDTHLLLDFGDLGALTLRLRIEDAEYLARQLNCPQPLDLIQGFQTWS